MSINPTIDRSGWGAGPWDGEPDKVVWTDEAAGLVCMVRRHGYSGHLCGYVGVGPDHPCHGMAYGEVGVDVHGGLSFSEECDDDPVHGICHVPEPGQPDHLWWFGFDCHQSFDQAPGFDARIRKLGIEPPASELMPTRYRTVEYVRGECRMLAGQLAELRAG